MNDEIDERSGLAELNKREDFWVNAPLRKGKGDPVITEGMFSDDGSSQNVRYQADTSAHINRQRDWMLISGELTGRVGWQITISTARTE